MKAKLRSLKKKVLLNYLFYKKRSPKDLHEAYLLLDSLSPQQFTRLKNEIHYMVVYHYYQKKMRPKSLENVYSIYNVIQVDSSLRKLAEEDDHFWRKLLAQMVAGSFEVMRYFHHFKENGKMGVKIAIINVHKLRRASIRLVK